MTILKTILTAVVALLPAIAVAQEVKTLTWRDCQETAMLSNPVLAGYRRLLESARYSYYAGRSQSLPFPGISVSNSYSRNGSVNSSPGNNFSVNLNASETLFSMKSYADLEVQFKSVEKADVSLRAALADTRKNLLTSFVYLLYAQERIGVMENILAIREKSAEMINLKYESGRESEGNRLRTEAQLAQAKADLAQAKRDMLTAQRGLTADIGADDFVPVVASGTLSVPATVSDIDIDKAALLIPSVLSAKKSVELYSLKVKQTNADLFPILSATQGLGWNGVSELPGNRAWSLGLSLSWPLFSNGPTYFKNNLANAKSTMQKAEEDYRSTLFSAKTNLQSALAALETNIENVATVAMLLNAARQRYSESEIQYLSGTMSFQTWEDVEEELVSSEQTYLTSLRSVNIARTEVDSLLGIPLGD
ncbi:MAG: TolC family protein [Elusimicrobia bacterium]|nr:TolC family protein [Elusimicrobiota bacterium]